MRYEWNGVTSYSDGSYEWEPRSEWTQDNYGFMTPAEVDGRVQVWYTGDPAHTQLSGTFKAVFTWQGTEPVPETLYVKVYTNAQGAAWGSHVGGPVLSCDLQATATSSLGTHSDSFDSFPELAKWADGVKLVQKPTGGAREVTIGDADLNAEGSVTITPAEQAWRGDTSAYLTYKAHEVRLQIDSPTIETSYVKGGDTPPEGTPEGAPGPFPAAREPHKPNADGSKTTDAGVQWDGGTWVGYGDFFSNETGFATSWLGSVTSREWTLSGGNPRKVLADGLANGEPSVGGIGVIELGSNPDGSDLIKNSNLKVTVTDSDGVSLSNTFDIKWHLPLEKTRDLDTYPRRVIERGQELSNVASGETETPLQSQGYIDSVPALAFLSDIAGDVGSMFDTNVPGGIAGFIKKIDGVTHDPYEISGDGLSASGPNAWTKARYLDSTPDFSPTYAFPGAQSPPRIPPQYANDPQGWVACDFQYFLVKYWRVRRWYADAYSSHGFDGERIAGTTELVGHEIQPWFTPHTIDW